MLSKIQSLPRSAAEIFRVPDKCQESEKKRVISAFLPSIPLINLKVSILKKIRYNGYRRRQALQREAETEEIHGPSSERQDQNYLQRRSKVEPESDQIIAARKYFGKKMTVLKRSSDAAHLHHRSKYLTKVTVAYGKSQTSDSFGPRSTSRDSANYKVIVIFGYFRSKGNSILLDKGIHVGRGCQYKLMPIYQQQGDLPASFNINWSFFKKMSSLKQIHLCLEDSKHYHVKITVDNKSIKACKLSYYDRNTNGGDMEIVNSCILGLPRQPGLSEVDLDLTSFAKDFKIKFLTLLGKFSISGWQIKDSLKDANEIYAEKCVKILNETEFIYFLTVDERDYHHCSDECNRTTSLRAESRKGITFIYKRDLYQDMNFDRRDKEKNNTELTIKDLTPLLYCCQSLKSLCLDCNGKLPGSMSDENVMFIESLKNINNVVIRPFYQQNYCGLDQMDQIAPNPQFRFISLTDAHKDQNSDLEYLELVDCENLPPNYSEDNFIARYLKNTYNSLDKISTLKHLNISFNIEFDQQIVHNLFNSLQNLQKLNMRVVARTNDAWDEAFPFARLNHLREFRLTVDLGHREGDDQYYLDEPKWGLQLAKSLSDIQFLETFELQGHNDRYMELPVFFGLLKGCCQLTRLKSLIIYTQTVKERDMCEYDGFMPSLWNENMRQRRKMLEDMLEELLQIIKTSNPALEVINLAGLRMYETGAIFYAKDVERSKIYEKRRQWHSDRLCYSSRRNDTIIT